MRAQSTQAVARLSVNAVKNRAAPLQAASGDLVLADGSGTGKLWLDAGGYCYSAKDDGNAAKSEMHGPQLGLGVDLNNQESWLAGMAGQVAMLKANVIKRDYDAGNRVALAPMAARR